MSGLRFVTFGAVLGLAILTAATYGCNGTSQLVVEDAGGLDATSVDASHSDASNASDARATVMDGKAPDRSDASEASDDDGEAATSACSSAMQIELPVASASMNPPSAGSVQRIQFVASGSLGLYVRVYASPAPKLTVSSSCDGTASAVATGSTGTGAYAHGLLPTAGTWFVTLDWSGVTTPASFLFDALSFEAGPSCANTQPWDGVSPLSFAMYAGVDTTGGCSPAPVFGQQFFSVSVPANSNLFINALAVDGSAAGSVVVEAAATCAKGLCSSPPATGSLTLANDGDAGATFVLGVSAGDPMNAGAVELSATVPATCNMSGQPCGDAGQGICCNGACVEPGVSNGCGTACGQACPADPADHGTAICSGSQCAIDCGTSGYAHCGGSSTGACNIDLQDDSSNCGTCSHSCPTGAICQSGQCLCVGSTSQSCGNCGMQSRTCTAGAWSAWAACTGEGACMVNATQPCPGNGTETCSSACAWGMCSCGAGAMMCGSTCTDVSTDPLNCGVCGNDCTTQAPPGTTETCVGGTCSAPSCLDSYCPTNGDAANGCFQADGSGAVSGVCWDNGNCDLCAWNGTCNTTCTTSSPHVCGC